MAFTYAALIDFLPRFLIAGVVTYFFVSAFSKLSLISYERPKFILSRNVKSPGIPEYAGMHYPAAYRSRAFRANAMKTGTVSTYGPRGAQTMNVTLFSGKDEANSRREFLKELQMILLGADMWLLLSIALSPLSTVSYVLPDFQGLNSMLLYSALAGTLLVALTGTVVSRVRVSARMLAVLLAVASVIVVALFFMPSMVWVNKYSPFFRIVVEYTTVLVVCVAVYLLSVRVTRKTAFYMAAFSTIAVYLISAFLLALNLFMTIAK